MRQISFWNKIFTILGILSFVVGIGIACIKVYPGRKIVRTAKIISTESVFGVEIGSPILYLGIPVGIVAKRELCDDTAVIYLSFDTDFTINDSSYVKLEAGDITGRKLLTVRTPDLSAAERAVPIIFELDKSMTFNLFDELFNLLREIQSSLQVIRSSAKEMGDKVNVTVEEVRELAVKMRRVVDGFTRSRIGQMILRRYKVG